MLGPHLSFSMPCRISVGNSLEGLCKYFTSITRLEATSRCLRDNLEKIFTRKLLNAWAYKTGILIWRMGAGVCRPGNQPLILRSNSLQPILFFHLLFTDSILNKGSLFSTFQLTKLPSKAILFSVWDVKVRTLRVKWGDSFASLKYRNLQKPTQTHFSL